MPKSLDAYKAVTSQGAVSAYEQPGRGAQTSLRQYQDPNPSVSVIGLKIVIISSSERYCAELSNCLHDTDSGIVRILNYYPSPQSGMSELLGDDCDVVIVELDSSPDHALDVVEQIRHTHSAKVMVCSSQAGPDLLMRCMRAGAREFLDLPVNRDQVVAAMVRAAASRQMPSNEKRAVGKLLAFMGTKGGAGVTTIATNFAAALAEQSGANTLFLDMDLPLGDAALNFGLTMEYSTIDALERIDRLDSNMLSRLTVKDRSGLSVLAAPGQYVSLQPSAGSINALLELSARSYDYVVVDVGSRLDMRGTSLFKIANRIYLVTQIDVSDLRNCNRLISQYFGNEYNNIEVVLSRYKRNGMAIDDKEIARLLAKEVRWRIPAEDAAVNAMHAQGVPLMRSNNSISKAIRKMVEDLVPPAEGSETPAPSYEAVPAERKPKPVSKVKTRADNNRLLSIFSRRDEEVEPESEAAPVQETRVYKGATYVKGEDGRWHAQVKPRHEAPAAKPLVEPQISWATPQPIDYGVALGGNQLNATANVEGAFVYQPAAGEFLNAGTHTLSTTFTPKQNPDNPVEASVPLTVNKLTPAIEWKKPESISYGKELDEEQLNARTDVEGNLVYNPPAGTILPEGVHALSVIFIPNDQVNYNTAVSVASITVSRNTPEIDWPEPAPIFYGTRLGRTELNAKASIPGMFVYTPDLDTQLPAGVHKLTATFLPEQSEYYRDATASTTLIVARATPEANWQQPPDIVYGTPLGPEHFAFHAKIPGSFEFSAAPGDVLCAGHHTLIAYFTPDDLANYLETEFESALTIAKKTPTLAWNDTAKIVYGTELNGRHLNAEASIPGTIEYTPGPGKILPVGRHTISASFTPADLKNYEPVEAGLILTVEKALPVVEWPEQISIAYGTPLSDQLLRIPTSVKGSFTLTPPAGEVLAAGTHSVRAVFVPEDTANYLPTEANLLVHVAKASPAIVWETPKPIAFGSELTAEQLNAAATVPGRFTYSPPFGKKLGAGTHILTAMFAPEDEGNYQSVQAAVQLTVAKATPAIQWPEPEAIVYGETLNEKQLRAQTPVPGSFEYSPAAGKMLEAGTYQLKAIFTPADADNYVSAQAWVKLAVNKAMPTLVWTEPAPIEWGTPLSATQLNAQANVRGSFVYSPAEKERLKTGAHTLSVNFLPEDARNYAPVRTSTSITVNRATPKIVWNPVSPVAYGTVLGPDQLNAQTDIHGEFVYSPAAGTLLEAGTVHLTAIFVPEDDANYSDAEASATLVVEKTVPAIDWPKPDPIEYGTALSKQQLNASSTMPGKFTYMPPAGSLLSAGSHRPTVLFTPDDNANYLPAGAEIVLEVRKATPKIRWSAPEPIVSGNPLSVAQLNAKASVPGKFAYFPRAGTVLPPGTHTIESTFVPTDAANYAPVQTSVMLTVIEIKEVTVDWKSPAPIRYGTPLGADQLNARSSVPGTFVYSPAEGTVLAAGAQTLMVTFIPEDDLMYAASQCSVSLTVLSSDSASNANATAAAAGTSAPESGSANQRGSFKRKQASEPAPQDKKLEVRVYKGATYVKEADGQWHLEKP